VKVAITGAAGDFGTAIVDWTRDTLSARSGVGV